MNHHSEASAHSVTNRGHEPTVLSGRTVAIWAGALGILILIALSVTWGLWQSLQRSDPRESTPLSEVTVTDNGVSPARAPLNPHQQATRRSYMQRQQELLTEYGWVDRPANTGRIPIERAMTILVERVNGEQ